MSAKSDFKQLFKNYSPGSGITKRLMADLLAKKEKRPPVIWLGTNTCAGDSISFLNSLDPSYRVIISDLIDFRYNSFLMTAEGNMATGVLRDARRGNLGDFILIVEGNVPTRFDGLACVIGLRDGKPYTALEAVRELGAVARFIVAVGTCAAFGGPYAASPNPIGGKSVQEVLDRRVINVPGCPTHPDWVSGTLAHLIWYGEPELDEYNRPTLFYGETIHNLCQRRHYFESGIFSAHPGEPWCMYKEGCKGPVTFADCPQRQWNGEHVNWPVGASTPCIGCVNPGFPDDSEPFFEHLPDIYLPGMTVNSNRVGAAVGAVTAVSIGGHLLGTIARGRLANTLKKGFSPPKLGLQVLDTTPAGKVKEAVKMMLRKAMKRK